MTFLWQQRQAVVPVYSMKARAYTGNKGTAPHVLNLNNQSRLASASLPGHFSPRKEPQRQMDIWRADKLLALSQIAEQFLGCLADSTVIMRTAGCSADSSGHVHCRFFSR